MKKSIIWIIWLSCLCNTGIFSQYVHLVEDDKYWIYNQYYHNDGPQLAAAFLIRFHGDTIIENRTYKKVWKQNLSGTHPCPMGQAPCFVVDVPYKTTDKILIGFIKEDTTAKNVYHKSINDFFCSENEYLLFNFSLKVDDKLDSCSIEALGGRSTFGNVDSITVQQIYNKPRKVFHTYGFATYIGLPYEGRVDIIEGIGYRNYGPFHSINNLNVLADFCQGTLSECQITSSAQDIFDKSTFTLYPNPTSDFVVINTSQQIKSILLRSTSGQAYRVPTFENKVDLSDLPASIYFIDLELENGTYQRAKVVKY